MSLNCDPDVDDPECSRNYGSKEHDRHVPSEQQNELNIILGKRNEYDTCAFCCSAPKNGIFLHNNVAHHSCYSCAKRTVEMHKRCLI
ncbi:hypothetical protein ABEB36_013484 [Hypothenemus hampei]|uniref:Uncharacterized protein n=1 Tax=Hypothenemus hampei TaxID=57062 RepID=A0ABD1E6I0_HYPHA